MKVARHQQLAELLLAQINDGTFAVGDRLPTEEQLSEAHGIARGTVRRALGRLEQLGMINRLAGSGTTVIATSPVAAYQPLAQSATDIATLAAETRLVKPTMGPVTVNAALARRLGTRPGAVWFVIEGPRVLRSQADAPLCWSEHYVRGDSPTPRLLEGTVDLEELAHQRVDQTISAALLEPHMAEALDAKPDSAALVITRRHRDEKGRLIAVGIHTHPADRYQISSRL